MTITLPSPGMYPDVPFEDYLKWPAVSNSGLTWLAKSAAHFRHAQAGGLIVEETPSMKLGTLCHAGQFEPEKIIERYAVMPRFEELVRRPNGGTYENPKMSQAYKLEVAEWEKQHADKLVVTQDEFDRMAGVVRAIASHPKASELLAGPAETEISLVWNDPETGIPCKARLDYLRLTAGKLADLKTTADAADWGRTIRKREYHRQFAFYRSGVKALTGVVCEAWNVVAETAAPWCVRCAPLSAELIAAGTDIYRFFLHQLADCLRSDRWPGYEDPIAWND